MSQEAAVLGDGSVKVAELRRKGQVVPLTDLLGSDRMAQTGGKVLIAWLIIHKQTEGLLSCQYEYVKPLRTISTQNIKTML